jgi:hypothetical protein
MVREGDSVTQSSIQQVFAESVLVAQAGLRDVTQR